MNSEVLRRKLQKKKKHKPYRKCPQCARRMKMTLLEGDHDGWHLYKHCGGSMHGKNHNQAVGNMECIGLLDIRGQPTGCGYFEELFWTGVKG